MKWIRGGKQEVLREENRNLKKQIGENQSSQTIANHCFPRCILERQKSLELSTSTLARLRSTN